MLLLFSFHSSFSLRCFVGALLLGILVGWSVESEAQTSTPQALYNSAYQEIFSKKDYGKAESVVQQGVNTALNLEQKDSFLYLKSIIFIKTQKYEEAERILKKLITHHKQHPLLGNFHSKLSAVYSYSDKENLMLHHYKKALSFFSEKSIAAYICHRNLYFFYSKKEDKKALVYAFLMFKNQLLGYAKARLFHASNLEKYKKGVSSSAFKIAYQYEAQNEYNKALDFYTFSAQFNQKLLKNNPKKLANVYINLAYINFYLQHYQAAEKYTQKSQNENNKSSNPNLITTASIWTIKAQILQAYQDYEQAFLYFQKAKNIAQKAYASSPEMLVFFENNLGQIEYLRGNHVASIAHFQKAQAVNLNTSGGNYLKSTFGLARSYAHTQPKKARILLHSVIQKAETSTRYKRLLTQGKAYYQLAILATNKNASISYHQKAKDCFDACPYASSDAAKNMKKWALLSKNDDEFNDKIKEAMMRCLSPKTHFKVETAPQIEDIIFPLELISCYQQKGDKFFQKNPLVALSAYKNALQVGEQAKPLFHYEGTKSVLSRKMLPIYQKAMGLAVQLWKKTQESSYFDLAFNFSEKTKSIRLLDALNEYQAIDQASIPDSLFQRGQRLRGNIAHIKSWMQGTVEGKFEKEYQRLNEKLILLTAQYQDYIIELEQNYPKYFDLKYDSKAIDINAVQNQLQKDELIIEYSILEDKIYVLALSQNKKHIHTQTINKETFIQKIQFINEQIQKGEKEGIYDELEILYGLILGDIIQQFENKSKIIVIPDGVLHHFSFDLLRKDDAYLIEHFNILYHYSSSQLSADFSPQKEKNILAVSPQYISDKFPPLPHAQQEILDIQKEFKGICLLDENATISSFKQKVAQHNIVHLAGHTHIDMQHPLRSYLVFSETKDSSHFRLFAHEIYNMKFQSDMITLSACDAGLGKIQEGEGSLSLARGFAYSGCPTTTSTLWSMVDKPTKDIMVLFYKNLKKGMVKSSALRQAKLHYLQKCGPKSDAPLYWAGIVIMGSDSPLVQEQTFKWWYIGVFLFVILLGVIFKIRN